MRVFIVSTRLGQEFLRLELSGLPAPRTWSGMFAKWQLQAQGKRCDSDSADATTASKITSFVTAKLLSKAKMPVQDARNQEEDA